MKTEHQLIESIFGKSKEEMMKENKKVKGKYILVELEDNSVLPNHEVLAVNALGRMVVGIITKSNSGNFLCQHFMGIIGYFELPKL